MLTTGQQSKLVQFWFHSSASNGLSPFTGKYMLKEKELEPNGHIEASF